MPGRSVLYVDDEPKNLETFERVLRGQPFVDRVFTTTSPAEALKILDEHDIAVIVADQRMPEMSGTELLARVLARHPEPVRIILTAFTEVREIIDAINRGHIYYFVTKPYEPEELRLIVQRAVEHHDTVKQLQEKNVELHTAYTSLEEAHREQVRLYEMVISDEKTGVRNYHYFRIRLGEEFERTRRYGGQLALIMLDIDDFKRVNDKHGHLVGDTALKDMAQILVEKQRAVDIVARYGGEEFVLILPETGLAGARAIAERLRDQIGKHAFVGAGGAPVSLTVSVGLSVFPHPEVTSKEELIQRADRALYRAKQLGKNRVSDD